MLGMASTVLVLFTTTVVFSFVSMSTAVDMTVCAQAMLMRQADPLLARQRQQNRENCVSFRSHTCQDRTVRLSETTLIETVAVQSTDSMSHRRKISFDWQSFTYNVVVC